MYYSDVSENRMLVRTTFENRIPFLMQPPPVDALVLARDETESLLDFYFFYRLEFVILGELDRPSERVLSYDANVAAKSLQARVEHSAEKTS